MTFGSIVLKHIFYIKIQIKMDTRKIDKNLFSKIDTYDNYRTLFNNDCIIDESIIYMKADVIRHQIQFSTKTVINR